MKYIGEYRIEEFPASRLATVDIGRASQKKHHMKALIEIDVTEARKLIHEKKKQKIPISFNAWLIKCISLAIEECRDIHGIRKGKKKVVLFDDIDISMMIERELDGKKVPLPYIIRKTNEKSITDIFQEISSGKNQSIVNEGNYVLGEKQNEVLMKAYYLLPCFVRNFIWTFIMKKPFITKETMGTVLITSVGMMGKLNGWVIPVSIHPLSFAIGSIIKKPGVKDNRIEIRDYLYITVSADHDVIDGAPAIRVLSRLTNMIEKGYGIN